ncbi:MAG TPA: trypsin-like peptidase domain-containing protein [Fimbriiglobus sp.]|nr:trypsin-like peptidase domain-containing protein [Fimbriiglobus sp.]
MNHRAIWTLLVVGGSFAGGTAANFLFVPRALVVAQTGSSLPPRPGAIERREAVGLDQFDEIIRRVAPAVVAVDAVKAAAPSAPRAKGKTEEESGSGVIVRLAGSAGCYAVTNNHVVNGARAGNITVTLADGRILVAERVWVDPASDVAILKLPAGDLPTAELGDSDRARVGHWVLAFGSPFGLNQTVTHGIISARDRGQISLGDTIRIKEFLQTDAAINPGSSGGPLVDLTGAVVGINTAIASNNGNNSGVSFSIPSNLVRRVARELLTNGVVSRGYLGMQLSPTLEPAAALRLGLTRAWGARVESVHPGGPAATGGVRAGDVVLKLDTVEVRNENHLINLIGSLPVGQRVRITVWRDRRSQSLDVVVGDWATAVGRNR